MIKAKFIRDLTDGWTGTAKLWELSEPIQYGWISLAEKTNFIITSAAYAYETGPETHIFPADKNGIVLNWSELGGSFRGDLDHERVICKAGFEIVNEFENPVKSPLKRAIDPS